MNEDLKKALIENGYDFSGVMERLGDSEDLYVYLLEEFMKEDNMSPVIDNYAAGDYEEMFTGIHTLKGVAGNLGLTGIYESSSALTEKLRSKEYDGLQPFVDAVSKAYDDCLTLLKTYL